MSQVTFANDPLTVFGLIFQYPAPVECSITKYCFTNCRYCFSNLNKKANNSMTGSKTDTTDLVIKRIQKANGQGLNPDSFLDYYLAAGYPITFSNNVDPFMPLSEKEFRCGERMLKTCLEYEQPLNILTKEVYTENTRDLLIQAKDLISLYVTVTNATDEGSKKWEPGAPATSERLRRMADMSKNGVDLTVGLNPYVPEWVGKPEEFFKRLVDVGVREVFINLLHTDKKRFLVTDPELRKVPHNRHKDFLLVEKDLLCGLCEKLGLEVYTTNYWPRKNHGVSPKIPHFPIDMNVFLSDCFEIYQENGEKPLVVRWEGIDKYFSNYDEWNFVFNVSEIMNAIIMTSEGHKVVAHSLGKRNSIKNILKFCFNNPDVVDIDFHGMVDATSGMDGKKPIHARDEEDNLIFCFHPYCKPSEFGNPIDIDKTEVIEFDLDLEIVSSEDENGN